jgi:OmpA-OmpF porin, OOP family
MRSLLTASIIAAALASPAAFAQVTGPGPYIGASVGASEYKIDNCIGTCDKTDVGMKLFGGYMFTPFIGAELAYGSYGKAKVNANLTAPGLPPINADVELKSSGLSGFLVGQYPIENFMPFVKLGFSYFDNEIDVKVPGYGSGSNSDTSAEFAWGLGVTYMFNKNFGLRGEYEYTDLKWEGEKQGLSFWSVGVQYNF